MDKKKYSVVELAIGFLLSAAAIYGLSLLLLKAKNAGVLGSSTPVLKHTGIVQPPKKVTTGVN